MRSTSRIDGGPAGLRRTGVRDVYDVTTTLKMPAPARGRGLHHAAASRLERQVQHGRRTSDTITRPRATTCSTRVPAADDRQDGRDHRRRRRDDDHRRRQELPHPPGRRRDASDLDTPARHHRRRGATTGAAGDILGNNSGTGDGARALTGGSAPRGGGIALNGSSTAILRSLVDDNKAVVAAGAGRVARAAVSRRSAIRRRTGSRGSPTAPSRATRRRRGADCSCVTTP